MINLTKDIVQKPALTPEDEQLLMTDKQVMDSAVYKEATQKNRHRKSAVLCFKTQICR